MSDNAVLNTKRILNGKIALITGGASGIGQATALFFAREGAAVAIVDLNQTSAQTVVQAIINNGGRAIFIHGDVSQAKDCQHAVRQTVSELGGLHILVNCAGIIRRTSVLDTSEEEWDHVMAVNVKSVFLFSKHSIPIMIKAGGGVIINIASGWGMVGGRKAAAYCASKAAVVNLTRAMALDHGEQNIRVNCICPGDTDTLMLQSEAQQLGINYDHMVTESAAHRPLKRIGRPEDIAQAALYLASDASSFVTGVSLVVDGGGLAGE
ncbi:MAG: SDR family NAD(P)-dependent oxidoreductase [Candidatus Heimdallarchaeota archaeon]